MKKNFFALAALSLLPITAAHAVTENRSALGVQAGVNFGNASTPSQISTSTQTGYSVGANLDIGLGSVFSLQPELNFVQSGSTLVDSGGIRVNTTYRSLQLPVMFKARVGEWKAAPYLFAGPVATFHLSREAKAEVGGTNAAFNFRPKQWDFGVAAGIGLDLGPFFANARYNLGLVDIDEAGANFQSRGFQILAGLRI